MKKYLNSYELFIEALEKNENFYEHIYEMGFELQCDEQYFFSKYIALDGIVYHDNYQSFYHTLGNLHKFISSSDKLMDYLSDEGQNVLKKLKEKYNVLCNMVEYTDNYYNLEEWLEKKAQGIIDEYDDWLRSFEEQENIDAYIRDECFIDSLLNDYYIVNNDFSKIYEDVTMSY